MACLGYHLAEDAPALLAPEPEPERGSRMVLEDCVVPKYAPTTALARLTAQYAASRHDGLICDFDHPPSPFWQEFLPMLEAACSDVGLPLWVPEAYGVWVSKSPVILPSDCTEGTFQRYLERAASRWPQGCVLELRPLCCAISLPCQAEPQQLPHSAMEHQAAQSAAAGFSEALCCRWGLAGEDPVTVLLWEDQWTLEQKLVQAEAAGFQAAIGLWQEWNALKQP